MCRLPDLGGNKSVGSLPLFLMKTELVTELVDAKDEKKSRRALVNLLLKASHRIVAESFLQTLRRGKPNLLSKLRVLANEDGFLSCGQFLAMYRSCLSLSKATSSPSDELKIPPPFLGRVDFCGILWICGTYYFSLPWSVEFSSKNCAMNAYMESVIQSYHNLLQIIESLQQSGKFSLGEASGIFTHLVQMKKGIEEAHVSNTTVNNKIQEPEEDVEALRLDLISTRIELDNAKRSLEDAEDRIKELESS